MLNEQIVFNTPTRWALFNQSPTQCSTEHIPSWWRRRWKDSLGRVLVKISANWSWEETKEGRRMLSRKASRMTWYWTSMCLVRRWNSGFLMRRKALWLFVNRGVGEIGAFPRLVSKRLCQIISLVVEEVDRYSASVVLLAQLACFPGSPKNGTMIHEKYETCAWFPVVKIHGEIGITVSGEGDGMIVPGEGKAKIQSASKIFENAA